MSIKDAYDYAVFELMQIYERSEAQNIMKFLLEDMYDIRNVASLQEFDQKDSLDTYLKRLIDHEPLQYITGRSDFYGLSFKVNNHVLIPRPETEELVHWVLSDHKSEHHQSDVLDIGTGSGCICVTLKKKKPTFRVFGLEESMDALNCSRINAKKHGVNIEFFRADILDRSVWDLFSGFDIIVSNPPYITEEEAELMRKNVLDYEPALALFVNDDDPLIFYRAIAEFAAQRLNPGGKIYLELNEFYADKIGELFDKDFGQLDFKKDMQGKVRMLRVSRP